MYEIGVSSNKKYESLSACLFYQSQINTQQGQLFRRGENKRASISLFASFFLRVNVEVGLRIKIQKRS